MSSPADIHHELVVDAPLADELVRRGVVVNVGDRVWVMVTVSISHEPAETGDAAWDDFVGSFTTGDPDFAERSEEILRAELGQ